MEGNWCQSVFVSSRSLDQPKPIRMEIRNPRECPSTIEDRPGCGD